MDPSPFTSALRDQVEDTRATTATVATALAGAVGADEVLFTEVAATDGTTTAWSNGKNATDLELGVGLSEVVLSHPAVVSYLRPGDRGEPRRVSDVVTARDWVGSAVYADVFRERRARYQLSIVTDLDATRGRGWILCRAGADFTDHEVALATHLLPLLRLIKPDLGKPRPERPPDLLTPRELEVLSLVATGDTVDAVARRVGSSPGTIRKHLEHVYRKFDVSSRLAAVETARERGLLLPKR